MRSFELTIVIMSRARLTGSCCVAATWLLATDRPAGGGAPAALRQGTYTTANCRIIDHFTAFEPGLSPRFSGKFEPRRVSKPFL
eukprot:COSAG06_NODE_43397_length_372_cov_1.043956_1_plen_84_part_00